MSTTYTRKGVGGKKNEKRSFNFVIKGLLISTTLVGSILTTGLPAFANSPDAGKVSAADTKNVAKDKYQDEAALISNVKMANKVLEAAIKEGQLTPAMYGNTMKALAAIDAKLTMDQSFNKSAELLPILDDSDRFLKASITTDNQEIITKRQESIKALENVQMKFGITDVRRDEGVSSPKGGSSEEEVVKATATPSLRANQYQDYNPSAYWSQDMQWAIDQGLVNGFINQRHPSNPSQGVGNWLDPRGSLTEAQMVSILMRYEAPNEVESVTPTNPNYWASTAYQVAASKGLRVKGSPTARSLADANTTRGTLAQAMATLHTGSPVSVREAVQFMYDTGITTGKTDASGNAPMTYESFGVNDPLERAQMVAFMKRYHDYKTSGKVNTPPVTPAPPSSGGGSVVTPPSNGLIAPPQNNQVGNIQVRYGDHTYGTKSQAEYDYVMKAVLDRIDERFDTARDFRGSERSSRIYDYFDEYVAGARPNYDNTNPENRNERNLALVSLNTRYSTLVELGIDITSDEVDKLVRGSVISSSFYGATGNLTGHAYSAYDLIKNRLLDCNSIAYVESAVYDSLGFNTAILVRPGHSYVLVEVQGKWVTPNASGFESIDPKWAISQGRHILAHPTNGQRF